MPGIASSGHIDRSQPRKPRGSSMTYVPIPPQDGQGDDEVAAGLSGNSEEEVQEPSQGEQPSPEEQPPSSSRCNRRETPAGGAGRITWRTARLLPGCNSRPAAQHIAWRAGLRPQSCIFTEFYTTPQQPHAGSYCNRLYKCRRSDFCRLCWMESRQTILPGVRAARYKRQETQVKAKRSLNNA